MDQFGFMLVVVGVSGVLFFKEDKENSERTAPVSFILKGICAFATMIGFAILLFLVHKPLFSL